MHDSSLTPSSPSIKTRMLLSVPIFNSIKNRLGFSSSATCNNSDTKLLKFIIKKKGTYSLLCGICSEIHANIIIFCHYFLLNQMFFLLLKHLNFISCAILNVFTLVYSVYFSLPTFFLKPPFKVKSSMNKEKVCWVQISLSIEQAKEPFQIRMEILT